MPDENRTDAHRVDADRTDAGQTDAKPSFSRAPASRSLRQGGRTARARFAAASDRLAGEKRFDPNLAGASDIELLEHATALIKPKT